MHPPISTRIFLALATLLFVSGCCLGFIGLHPAVQNPALSRLGILLALCSLPPWIAVMAWQNRQLTAEQLRDARLSGYAIAMNQRCEGLGLSPEITIRVPQQRRRKPRTRKRGS
ncbi:hypothetical protein VSR01_16050 [Actinacidiphila sp. DG2A-62]|uniref:hypothetical protein n=1 Tax=Actinacidiphila sp. DG2A-62 TaxID=3108821 RepID=UPI002DBF2C13|nr:hypothetical protein [Actinacidiphila sp. DG2A-62]MEC3994957.1 hypothetical protein [Actinacidiphila sp. DG2A-62]